jgi:hypothetical protein
LQETPSKKQPYEPNSTKQPYTTPPSEYIRRKQNLTQTTYIRKQGKGFYLVNGEETPAKEWEKANELPNSLVLGRVNPDKTRQWIY